jgi:hypothetical protein
LKRSPLRKVSKKRQGESAIYSKLRKKYLAEHPYCEWWLAERGLTENDIENGRVQWNNGFTIKWITPPPSAEIHHKRGRFGSRLNDTRYWMAVSSEGHAWIHKNTGEAYEKGYLIQR